MTPQHLPPSFRQVAPVAPVLSALPARTGAAFAAAKLGPAQIETQLRGAGILWRATRCCADRNRTVGTSFKQVNSSSVNRISKFKQSRGCPVTFTRGAAIRRGPDTHSHYAGYHLDIVSIACVPNWIVCTYPRITRQARDHAPLYRSRKGNIHANEGAHREDSTFLHRSDFAARK
jgi:hypothetical protein